MTTITRKQREFLNGLSLEDLTGAGMSTAMTRGEVIEFVIDHVTGLLDKKMAEIKQQIDALDQSPVLSEAEIPERLRPVMAFMRVHFNRTDLTAFVNYGCGFTIERPPSNSIYNIVIFRDEVTEDEIPARMKEQRRLQNIGRSLQTKKNEINNGDYKHALMDRLLQSTEAGRAILQDVEQMADTAVASIITKQG